MTEAEVQHVFPTFGREHVRDLSTGPCWCEPEPDPENPLVLVHHPEQ